MNCAKFFTFLLLAGSLVFVSCEKDKDIDAKQPDKILTSGTWKLTALTVDPAIDWFGTSVTNVYSQLPTCTKDDLTTFQSNGTVNFDEGPSKCSTNDPQTFTGLWALSNDKKTISITLNGETESWKINQLSSSSVQVDYEQEDEYGSGLTYTFTATYTKQ